MKLLLDIKNQLRHEATGGNLLKWRVNNEFIKSQTMVETLDIQGNESIFIKTYRCGEYVDMSYKFLYEAYGEYIAYHVAKEIGFGDYVIPYKLVDVELKDSNNAKLVACSSENFLSSGESFYGVGKFAKDKGYRFQNVSGYGLYNEILKYIDIPEYKEYLERCLILDYIILNIDRHLNNIGFIANRNGIGRIPTIFDNGACLGCNMNLVPEIKWSDGMKFYFRQRPFYMDFDTQIELIKPQKTKISHNISRVYTVINKLDIPEYRKEFMVDILKQRIQDIKNHGI